MYQLDILDPANTLKTLSHRETQFNQWSEVEARIITDKHQWFDCSHLPIKFEAHDETVALTGSFGV